MIERREEFVSVHMGAKPGGAAAAIDAAGAIPADVLDSSEIVEFSIKPSLWFIAIVSVRFVAICLVLAGLLALAAREGWTSVSAYTFLAFIWAAVGRVLVAGLQWASRLYVLTNRRVMRFSGVLHVTFTECPLRKVNQAHIKLSSFHRLVGMGTIRTVPVYDRLDRVNWEHVARPGPIYERLIAAIRRSQNGQH